MNLTYRKALEADLMTYFNWANDIETRQNSFHSNPIDLNAHSLWFLNKIKSDKSQLLIFENDTNQPIGQVRIDSGLDETVIGISIDKAFKGKGLAAFMIDSACKEYFRNFTGTKIIAHIKAANIASCKAFEKAGFQLIENHIVEGENRLILIKENV